MKKGFTLVELLVVIAILAILAIVATPRILDLFNDAKKNAFLIDVKGLYKAATQKYISESLKGNNVTVFSSDGPNKLNLDNDNLEYYVVMDDDGKVIYLDATNGEYSIQTTKTDSSSLVNNDVSDEEIDINIRPNTDPIQNIPSTTSYLDKTKFWSFVTNNSPTEIYFTITGHSTGTDISNDPTEPIYAWMEGTKMYVSAREPNKKVSAPVDSSYLFSGNYCSKLKDVEKMDVEHLNTKNVTNMSNMFYMSGYNATTWDIGDLSSWDTSNVTNMSTMFYDTGGNTTTFSLDLSNWNTSQVTDMSGMFYSAGQNVTTWSIGDLSKWDTSKVTDMSSMFFNSGKSATTWSVGNISNWDVSNVTNMRSLFGQSGQNATTWFIGDLSNWNTSQVTDMAAMFSYAGYNATTFQIKGLNNWDTSQVTDMWAMFYCAGFNATTFKLNLGSWDTSKVINMSEMFSWSGYSATTWSIGDLSKWDTSNVTDMHRTFYCAGRNATTFNLDLNAWDTSKVTDMSEMFYSAGQNATTFEIKIPKRSNGTSDNTTSSLRGLSTSTTPPSGRTFTLVD